MDIISAIFIALGATVGVLMLINLLKGHHIPKALTLIHGILVVTGLILLILFNFIHPESSNWISVGLFIIAAMGGGYILYKDIEHKKVPMPIVMFHGIIALSSFIIMVLKIKISKLPD